MRKNKNLTKRLEKQQLDNLLLLHCQQIHVFNCFDIQDMLGSLRPFIGDFFAFEF